MKTYIVLLNGTFLMRTKAVSSIKAINNARYRIFKEKGAWFNVPSMDEFDVVKE